VHHTLQVESLVSAGAIRFNVSFSSAYGTCTSDVAAVSRYGVLVPVAEGRLTGVSPADGSLTGWSAAPSQRGDFFSFPTPLQDGRVAATTRFGTLAEGVGMIDSDGTTIWTTALRDQYQTRFEFIGPPAVLPGDIFIVATDSMLLALNASTGRALWNRTNCDLNLGGEEWQQSQPLSLPLGLNSTVVALCTVQSSVRMTAFVAETGKEIWSTSLGLAVEAFSVSNFVFSESLQLVLVTTASGGMLGLDPSTGLVKFNRAWLGGGGVPLIMGASRNMLIGFNFSEMAFGVTIV